MTRAAGLGNLAGHFATLLRWCATTSVRGCSSEPVELEDKIILYRLTEGDARAAVSEAFRLAINSASVTSEAVSVEAPPDPGQQHSRVHVVEAGDGR